MKSLSSQLCLVTLLTLGVTCQTVIDTDNLNTTVITNSSNSNNNDTLTVEHSSYNISANATGYKVIGQIQQLQSGLQFGLLANSNVSLYGNLISDLLVDVNYETTERLHVKIYDKERQQAEVPDSPLGLERPKRINLSKKRSSIRPGNNYEFNYTADPFSFQVLRKSNGETIFDTRDYPLVFEDQYLEISTHIPNTSNIYGFGESISPFRRKHNITTLFNRDSSDEYNGNQYGSHPFYIDHRNGSAHGTFLLNAHGMDVITEMDRITFKVIGGVLDFYFFVPQDSKPNSVVESYANLVGRPMMPSQWMLGLHHSQSSYSSVTEMQGVLDSYNNKSIPLESLWLDLDFSDKSKSFTIDQTRFPLEEVIQFSQQLHDNGLKLVARVDPSISISQEGNYTAYIKGANASVFIKESSNNQTNATGNSDDDESFYIGETDAGQAVFPDWWNPNITAYWDEQVVNFMNLLKLDGLWSSMNEPSSFGSNFTTLVSINATISTTNMTGDGFPLNDTLNTWPNNVSQELDTLQQIDFKSKFLLQKENLLYPGYAINNGAGNLSDNTVSMIAQHYGNQSHYDLHNLYGLAQSYITRNSILKYNSTTRPLLVTRSTFSGSGASTGHWTGENEATWSYLKSSISSILHMQIFGVPFTGANICGSKGNLTEELCTRWLQLGALYPFARLHHNSNDGNTTVMTWNSTIEAARQSMSIRYSLLPYFYTLFEESNRLGTGVWRPLIFEFPHSTVLADNDEQFMIGPDILVSPVTEEGAVSVDAQFPPGIWYDWYNLTTVISSTVDEIAFNPDDKQSQEQEQEQNEDQAQTQEQPSKTTLKIDAPLTRIPIHIRGGAIVPTKTPKLLVNDTFASPYNLIIALDTNSQAAGRLYLDDGNSLNPALNNKSSINFIFTGNALTVNGQFGYQQAETIANITILGVQTEQGFSNATIDQQVFNVTKAETGALMITNASIPLSKGFVMNFV